MNYPIDITNTVIKTERLILRPFKNEDLDEFYEYASVDGVGQMAGWLPHENKEKSQMILSMFIEEKKTFAIVYKNKVIGSLGIEKYSETEYSYLNDLNGREIGYVLSKSYWGNGFMPEAVKAVIKYLFETIKLDFVTIAHFDWNNQSRRVIEKCGFKYVKDIEYTTRYETKEHACAYVLMNKKNLEQKYKVIKLNDSSEIEELALFQHKKWQVPLKAYIESMNDSLITKTGVPAWYYVKDNDEVIAGVGVIENDFHKRKELTPNICAVYVKEPYQKRGIAKMLLDYVCDDLKEKGITDVYLLTTHKKFYERCGFEFFDMVEENCGDLVRCYHKNLDI